MQRQSAVLLECLPGFWQAAGSKDVSASSSSGSSTLALPANLPASAAAKLQQTIAGAAGITGEIREVLQGGPAGRSCTATAPG
jgi:hypothetical protein